jgi:hypothetical protein
LLKAAGIAENDVDLARFIVDAEFHAGVRKAGLQNMMAPIAFCLLLPTV